ncbi:MAG: hypothetical protein B7Z74_05060, partial [Deltaproteobacteria bacterium 21-66-5]
MSPASLPSKRRGLLLATLATALLCATGAPSQAQEPLKIGFIGTLSGPAGALGQDEYDAFMLAIHQKGGKLGGVPVTVIREDDQLKPDLGVQAATKLIKSDHVPIITGVTFSNVMMGEGNAVGRGGLGAVLGKKNLKAIAVDGDRPVPVADRERFDRARADVLRLFRASPVIFGELGISEYGTPALVDLMRQRRMAPTENFRRTVFDGSSAYSGPAIRAAYGAKKEGCFGCPIRCKKRASDGRPLPEYETVSHFGALNAISDLHAIVRGNDACNDLGMDTISAAATLSAWGEARGRFPSPEEVGPLLDDIAHRRGEGDLLAEGSRRVAEALGKPELSMSVKSLELPAYDPRGAYGMALAYVTSNRGGCHLRAYPISHEILRKPVASDRFSFSGKARMIKIAEDVNAAIDSLVACKFAFFGASIEEYAELLAGVTGEDHTPQSLKETGERVYLTERFYNSRNGFTRAEDDLPSRFFTEPGSHGEGIDVP